MAKRVIPDDIKREMCRDYRRGMTIFEIARVYGIGRNRTHEIIRYSCSTKRGRKISQTSALIYENVTLDYFNGLSIEKIAKKYNKSMSWVYFVLHKKGTEIRANTEYKKGGIVKDLEIGDISQSEIARKHNVSRQYVSLLKKQNGLD